MSLANLSFANIIIAVKTFAKGSKVGVSLGNEKPTKKGSTLHEILPRSISDHQSIVCINTVKE